MHTEALITRPSAVALSNRRSRKRSPQVRSRHSMSRKDQPEPLLPKVANGDPDAVRECISRYQSLIFWLARKQLGADAEDAVQDIFIELWRNAGRFDPSKASEPTFVSMVARRRIIDRRRKLSRQPQTETIEPERPIAAKTSVEATAEASLAGRAIDELDERERTALRLSVYEGLSHSEIAEHLGMPLGTVKTYIRRGLARVRDRLAQGRSSAEVET